MAVNIVVSDFWAENSADDFVNRCRMFGYFNNISDKALKYVYRIADRNHFVIQAVKTDEETADFISIDTILHNYFRAGWLNKLLIKCRFIKDGEELDMESVDLEHLSYMVRTYVDIDEFLAALNRLEAINEYTYYTTKDYWTFICISDSIFI